MNKSLEAKSTFPSESDVASLFDAMHDEYDEIEDLWYSWLASRLHYFMLTFPSRHEWMTVHKCLDVGCGTGFQSLLLSLCGKDVVGIDISRNLLCKAMTKRPEFYAGDVGLVQSPFDFVRRYDARLKRLAQLIRGETKLGEIEFAIASATCIPFADGVFDFVNCSGSTLSFIDKYDDAIREMGRVLRPGGILFIEVENKYNMDLLWPIIDSSSGSLFGFGQSLSEGASNLFSGPGRHITIDYPFSTHQHDVTMNIRLFSSRVLQAEIERLGFVMKRLGAIHCATNVLPSVVLDSPKPGLFVRDTFGALSAIETVVASVPFIRRLGCSAVYMFIKRAA